MAEGIILAGGRSRRIKTNKALLTKEGLTFLESALSGMKDHVERIFVVTGRYHEESEMIAKGYPKAIAVRNLDYEKGMFTSVKTGVRMTGDDFFILPVDCPFVRGETYEALMKSKAEIAVPVHHGKGGHPIFIKKALKEALLSEPDESNLRDFRDKIGYEGVEVDDPNVVADIDTKGDYEALLREGGKEQA